MKKATKYDYMIVGAGLFGSTFAHLATQTGKKCLVIDRRSHVGGNCYSRKMAGIDVHLYGPHIFHTSNMETWKFVDSMSPMRPFFNQPLANFRDELYNLPFNMNTFRQIFGVSTPADARMCIEQDRVPCESPSRAMYAYAGEFEFKGTPAGVRWVNKAAFKAVCRPEDDAASDVDIVFQELLKNRIILQPRYFIGNNIMYTNEGGSDGFSMNINKDFHLAMKNKWGKYFKFDYKRNIVKINVKR